MSGRCRASKNMGWTHIASSERKPITGIWGSPPPAESIGKAPDQGVRGRSPSDAENFQLLGGQRKQQISLSLRIIQTGESSSKRNRPPCFLFPVKTHRICTYPGNDLWQNGVFTPVRPVATPLARWQRPH